MSSKDGRSFICNEYTLIDKLVQCTYKTQNKKQIEQSDGHEINKDLLIILLHSIFDYDEQFMRDRINQDIIL